MNNRYISPILGLFAGLLICASLPPWGWWPLAFAGIALWLFLLGPNPDEPLSRWRRFAVSWAVGVGWFGPSTLWMWGLTQPGYVLGVLLAWGPMVGIVGCAIPASRRRLLALPAALVMFEWFHLHAPFGGIPLSMLGMTQGRGPLLGIARLGGPLLVAAVVASIGVGLYSVTVERRWKEATSIVVGSVILVGLGSLSLSLVHPVRDESGNARSIRLAAVQGGGPQGTVFSSAEIPLVFARHLEATKTIKGPVDLVMWPENAINIVGPFATDPWKSVLAQEAKRLDAPILVGVVEDDPTDPKQFLNYVVTVRPDGSLGQRYDKERRVPFGEYVPLRFLLDPIAKDVLPSRDAVPGVGSAAVDTGPTTAAVAISWEIFFPRRVREGVRGGGEVVLNPTNGSSYWLTQIQTQQLATSASRAVEAGRWNVQVAPTGFSAVFDDHGRILQRTEISEQKVLYADVPLLTGTTPAQALGVVPAVAAALVALLIVLVETRRESSSAAEAGHLTATPPHSEA